MAKRKGPIVPPPLEKGRGRYMLVLSQEAAPDLRWNAQVREVPAAITWGKSIDQAQRRAREALALFVDDAASAVLDLEIHAAKGTQRLIEGVRVARRRAEQEQERAQRLTREAARALARTMTVRDAAVLLGLSFQRVQQLVEAAKR